MSLWQLVLDMCGDDESACRWAVEIRRDAERATRRMRVTGRRIVRRYKRLRWYFVKPEVNE